ncbi:MAG: hypothetical protein LBF83_03430 [Spirochaetaceae bacterium]|jgi:uncharacterized ion transporter superfamily protein YfcC|nr:hypothetical protein [Spirochaetaceae bacterium]
MNTESAGPNGRQSAVKIGKKAFLFSAAIILLLMIGSGILTVVLPAGRFDRVVEDGRTLVVNGSYREIPPPRYPFWRWFTAPLEVLAGPDNLTPIVLVVFIIAVGGSIAVLESAGVMEALIKLLVARFAGRRYLLIALIIFFFMTISSFVGIYEGMVPMIIFIIPAAISLGFDTMTGLGMSLLPLAFGFASAVTNPFTIAVAQRIADLPLFSGAWLRIIFFVVVYVIVTVFVIRYARRVAANPALSPCYADDQALRRSLGIENTAAEGTADRRVWKALVWFALCVAAAMILVISTARMPGLSNLAFPVMTVLFLTGGIGGGFFAGLGRRTFAGFGRGALNILPGVVLVLMAYSVKQIITAGMIMDTILYLAAELIRRSPPMAAAFLIYAATLVMNFFIGSASAKAFLMMPLLTPLADLVGITRQTAVLAFDFGDGFSNMIFPTNALLLIALSFSSAGYTRWMAWTWKLQVVILVVTSAFLAFAVSMGFGPF